MVKDGDVYIYRVVDLLYSEIFEVASRLEEIISDMRKVKDDKCLEQLQQCLDILNSTLKDEEVS